MLRDMSESELRNESPASLFEYLPAEQERQVMAAQQARAAARRQGPPRLLQPNRGQIELRASELESLLGEDHRARLVWGYVERQDLSRLIESIKARGSNAGRSAIDPRILFALWLYATLDGVGSGREIARLTRESDAYRWICGGVSVNYHALNDFRSGNETLMDEVLTANVAALASAGAISLERVAQDGRRERAAQQREERIGAALEQLPQVQAAKRRTGDKSEDARASTTDAHARVMKMGDGGFRPAFNVQLATTCEDQVIVGVAVSNAGSDMAQMAPMVEQVIERTGTAPGQWLVDGGFPAHEQIDAVHEHTQGQTEVIAPVPEPKRKAGKPGDDDTPPPDKHQRKARRLRAGGAVARAHGRRRDQGRVQATRGHGRVRQRTGAQPRAAAHACARAGQGSSGGLPVRAGAQLDAHGQDRAADGRSKHRCVQNRRSGGIRGA